VSISQPDRIDISANKITWLTSWGELKETTDWLPEGKVKIAVTSGASTPDKVRVYTERVHAVKRAFTQ
jgi:4-hydroxy-3-methylbut-2-enyl diphosphate reductase IspH